MNGGNNNAYKKARKILYKIENKNGFIECYYSGKKFSYKSKKYNCEHVFPQSKIENKKGKTDLHHLIPTEKGINALRGNFCFGEATSLKLKSILKNKVFEVRDKSKGNIARAMFYYSVMYDKPIDDVQEKCLRKWNKIDPVDSDEIRRNNLIKKYQGNFNIFISNASYVDSIKNF
jgi:endonuclease I